MPGRPDHEHRVARAEAAWDALGASVVGRDGAGRTIVLDRAGGRAATLWPYSQVLHAAVVVGDLRDGPEPARRLGRGVERYRRGEAYKSRPSPGRGERFYDDNAWVGLAAAHARLLGETEEVGRLARRVLGWVRSGEDPTGGVRWREGRPGRHACSTGAAGILALRAGPGEGPGEDSVVAFARRCTAFLTGPLLLPSGLVADNVDRDRLDPTVWSYNQGLTIGLLELLDRAGVDGAGGRARELAEVAVRHFGAQDRLWQQPPCLVSVFGRMLLLLHSRDGDPRWTSLVDDYLDRVWAQAADGSGGFTRGGIGAYDRETTLDLAGIVVLSALRAARPDRLALIC